jgi:hypothetical protein
MANSLFKDISKSFSPDLPAELGSMDQHLDFILSKVVSNSEDLGEEKFWIGKRWREVRDDDSFHEAILHIFNTGGEYLLSFDGNIVKGTWRRLGNYNTLILDVGGRSELFDLRFMNSAYFVLSKHGDQARKGQRKYFFLVHEPIARNVDWRNLMERMFNMWREDNVNVGAWIAFIVIIAVILYLSFT